MLLTAFIAALWPIVLPVRDGARFRDLSGRWRRWSSGGLVTATALTLVLLPILYEYFRKPAHFGRRGEDQQEVNASDDGLQL